MPSYISKMGIWEPARERAVVKNTQGEPEIYEGADRAASEFMKSEGVTTLGMDVRKDPENIMRARQLGMTVDDFLSLNTPPTPEAIKNAEEARVAVVTHADPPKKAGVRPTRGGFYDPEKGEKPQE